VFKIFEPLLINCNKLDLHKTSQCTQVTICFREVLASYLKVHHKQNINPFSLEDHYICNLQCPKFPGFLLHPTPSSYKKCCLDFGSDKPTCLRHFDFQCRLSSRLALYSPPHHHYYHHLLLHQFHGPYLLEQHYYCSY
jgi:hypothetical protein